MAQEATVSIDHQNGNDGKEVSFIAFKPQVVVPAQKAEEAVQFYKAAFGAEEIKRVNHPKRKVDQELPLLLCAELKIGSSSFLVCDPTDDSSPPVGSGGSGIVFRLETENVAAAVEKALKAGAEADGEIAEVEGYCGSGLLGKVKDAFGVVWAIASADKQCSEGEA